MELLVFRLIYWRKSGGKLRQTNFPLLSTSFPKARPGTLTRPGDDTSLRNMSSEEAVARERHQADEWVPAPPGALTATSHLWIRSTALSGCLFVSPPVKYAAEILLDKSLKYNELHEISAWKVQSTGQPAACEDIFWSWFLRLFSCVSYYYFFVPFSFILS